jgi:2-polyprenyl-6-methoxyphenol hydroxylase-like FAD-dependent oxidoreductase
MAIEDAAALATRLGPLLIEGAGDCVLDESLRAYEAERRPQNAALLSWSHVLGTCFGYRGRLADGARRAAFTMAGTPMGQGIQRRIFARMASRSNAAPAPRAPGPEAQGLLTPCSTGAGPDLVAGGARPRSVS